MKTSVSNLDTIDKFLKRTDISDIELRRLNLDLNTVHERLINREYAETDFSTKNKYNIPERTQEFFKYLNDYCQNAKTRAKILSKFDLSHISHIANICP